MGIKKEEIKLIIGAAIYLLSIICGLYVGGWLMFVQPILDACHHFDAGTLTGTIVGITVLKCIFASAVGYIISCIGMWTGRAVAHDYLEQYNSNINY